MIKQDAKVKDSDGNICIVIGVYDDEILVSYGGLHAEDTDFLEHGTYTIIEDIRGMYEQEKQRADELESLLYTHKENAKSIPNLIEQIQASNKRADELEKNLNLINNSQENLVNELQQALSESNKRADRAEKQWEKLKEHFIKEKEQSFSVLNWSRNNGMLELMQQLEEDGE